MINFIITTMNRYSFNLKLSLNNAVLSFGHHYSKMTVGRGHHYHSPPSSTPSQPSSSNSSSSSCLMLISLIQKNHSTMENHQHTFLISKEHFHIRTSCIRPSLYHDRMIQMKMRSCKVSVSSWCMLMLITFPDAAATEI